VEILQKEQYGEYEQFVRTHPKGDFMQSIHWAEVKYNWKNEVVVSRNENGEIVGGMLVLIRNFRLGLRLLYSPRGPVCDLSDPEVLTDLLEGARVLAKKYKAFLFRCDPTFEETETRLTETFRSVGFRHKENQPDGATMQRRFYYILPDVNQKTVDQMLASFDRKCRYNIRVAQKHGIVCKSCSFEGLDDFYRIYLVTAQRDNFVARPREYFENLLTAFGEDARLYITYYEDTPLTGTVVCNYAGKLSYIYAASDNLYRNYKPNHMMLWEIIQWAIESGCHTFDFMQIPAYCDENSPTYGVYAFKKGFNGRVYTYAGEFDYVFRPAANALFGMMMKAYDAKNELARRLRKRKETPVPAPAEAEKKEQDDQ